MSQLLEGVSNKQKGISLESITKGQNTEQASLFSEYITALKNSTDTVDQDEYNALEPIIRTGDTALDAHQRTLLQKHLREFSDRVRQAEDVISVVRERKLEGVLSNAVADIEVGELSLYLKAIAVRSPDNLNTLKENILASEVAFHATEETTKADAAIKDLKTFGKKYKISEERLQILIRSGDSHKDWTEGTPLPSEFINEVTAALGGEKTETVPAKPNAWWQVAPFKLNEPSTANVAEEMCKRIIQYNQALEKAEESTHEFATQFSAIRANVSVDNKFIASIPTFREQANAIRDAKQKGEVPSLKDVQTALNPESLAAKMEEGLDANARTRLKTLTAGTMSNADIMNEYISGTTGPKFGDHFNEKMKGVSDNFGVKAVWNHLIGLIMGSLYAVEQLKSTATRDSVLDVIKKR